MRIREQHEPHDRDEARRPRRVRLPGFIRDDREIGLGDIVSKVTYAAGMKPCGGCERRRGALNRWIVFHR